jgi:hypothetical protein
VLQALPDHQSGALVLGTIGLDIIGGLWTAWQFTSAVATKKKTSKAVRSKMRRTALVVLPLAIVAAFVPWAGLALSVTGYAASVRVRANKGMHKERMKKLKRQRGPVHSVWSAHQKTVKVRNHIRNGRPVRTHTRDNPHVK